jgi:hypothetical protein
MDGHVASTLDTDTSRERTARTPFPRGTRPRPEEAEMHDDGRCPECAKGNAFSDATFDEDGRHIRWTMWSCGHCVRTVLDTDARSAAGVLAAPSELARPLHTVG